MEQENKYGGVKVVSFLFPLIGLIIYAVNIGKNDELAQLALKWSKRFFIMWIGIIALICLIIFIVFHAGKSTTVNVNGGGATTNEYVAIPNVENMTIENATKKLEELGFEVNSKYEKIPSEDIDKGNVVKTEPQAYRREKTSTKVTLYISTGSY